MQSTLPKSMPITDCLKTTQEHSGANTCTLQRKTTTGNKTWRLPFTGTSTKATRERLTASNVHTNELSQAHNTRDNREYRTLLWVQNSHASVNAQERPRAKKFAKAVVEKIYHVNNIPKYRKNLQRDITHSCAEEPEELDANKI